MELLYVDPLQEKTIKFPFDEKWADIQNKLSKKRAKVR